MGRKNIDAFWDRNNVLNVNNNFVDLYKDVAKVDTVVNESEKILSEASTINNFARETNEKNVNVQKQLNDMVIESGNANAEVSQARGTYSVLNERLMFFDDTINTDTYYSEITHEKYFDEISQTSYYLTKIPYLDHEGKIIKLKHGFPKNDLETAREFSSDNNTTFTANASVFNTTTNKILGIQITDGEIIHSTPHPTSYTLGIKKDNTLIATPPDVTAEELIEQEVYNALTGFFPIIENGIPVSENLYSSASPNALVKNPRQVIAQNNNKDTFFITVQGRGIDGEGMTYSDLIRICESLNINFAYNLDGGGSIQTVVRGGLLNNPIDANGMKERKVADFIYIDKDSPNKNTTKSQNYDIGTYTKKTSDLEVMMKKNMKENDERLKNEGEFKDIAQPINNVNTINKSGNYWARSTTIGSPGKRSYVIVHYKESDNYALQLAIPYHGSEGEMLMRRTDNSEDGWTDWRNNSTTTDWVNFDLLNNWVNVGGTDSIASYTIRQGVVHVRGLIKDGDNTIGNVISKLPSNARPLSRHVYSTISSGENGYELGRVFIEANGDIKFMNGGTKWFVLTTSFPIG